MLMRDMVGDKKTGRAAIFVLQVGRGSCPLDIIIGDDRFPWEVYDKPDGGYVGRWNPGFNNLLFANVVTYLRQAWGRPSLQIGDVIACHYVDSELCAGCDEAVAVESLLVLEVV